MAKLKTSCAESISDPEMIEILYDAVALPIDLLNQNGDTITVPKGTASKIVNHEVDGNVRQDIRTHSTDQRVLDSIDDFFKTEIVPWLLKGIEDDLIHRLKTIIDNDSDISADKKTLGKFLASVYLYSLSRKNVPSGDASKVTQTESDGEESKKHPLPKMTIPVRIGNKDRGYIDLSWTSMQSPPGSRISKSRHWIHILMSNSTSSGNVMITLSQKLCGEAHGMFMDTAKKNTSKSCLMRFITASPMCMKVDGIKQALND